MRKRSIKVFLVRRRVVAVLAALALAAGIFYAVSYPGSVSAAAAKRQLPIYSVERTDGKFHLLRRRVGQRGYANTHRHPRAL